MKKRTTIISILCLGLLLSLDVSAAGAIFMNRTGDYVAVAVKFDNNTEQAFLLPPNTQNKADSGIAVAGVSKIVYLRRGIVRQIGLDIPGIEGIRTYTLNNDGLVTINDAPWPQKQFTNPLGTTEVARGECDTCPAQKPCPTYTLTGG